MLARDWEGLLRIEFLPKYRDGFGVIRDVWLWLVLRGVCERVGRRHLGLRC